MGILPFSTPKALAAMERHREAEEQFLVNRGYKKCYSVNEKGHSIWPPNLKGPDGVVYPDVEEFVKAIGWRPGVIDKDGVCWNEYRVRKKDGFIDCFSDECDFLISRGYNRCGPMSVDHMKNIALDEFHYETWGYTPDWGKGNRTFGHEELLEKEGFGAVEPKSG